MRKSAEILAKFSYFTIFQISPFYFVLTFLNPINLFRTLSACDVVDSVFITQTWPSVRNQRVVFFKIKVFHVLWVSTRFWHHFELVRARRVSLILFHCVCVWFNFKSPGEFEHAVNTKVEVASTRRQNWKINSSYREFAIKRWKPKIAW